MKRIVHIKLRTILGILCLVICILPSTQNMKKAEAAESIPSSVLYTADWTAVPLADVALINTYLPHITEAAQAYYSQRGEAVPVISWCYVSLKEMTADPQETNPEVTLTFTLTPYTGAHNIVGVDEVTFRASHTGQITLLNYQRIQDPAA